VVDIALLQRLGEGRRLGIRGSVTRGSARYAKTLRKNITRKRLARACEGNSAEAQQPTNTRSHACGRTHRRRAWKAIVGKRRWCAGMKRR